MSDLIKELRDAAEKGLAFAPQHIKDHLCWIAADRIAELERQLAESHAREAKDYTELLDEFNAVKAQNVRMVAQLAALSADSAAGFSGECRGCGLIACRSLDYDRGEWRYRPGGYVR